jgi:YidC/Oxa1 family membrane protein insertase
VWDTFIELLRLLIVAGAHACGGSIGGGIALVSFLLRLALIPLSLKVARRAQEQLRKLAELKPMIERLQKRHAKEPAHSTTLARETMALYKRNGVRMLDPLMLVAVATQGTLFSGILAVIRAGLGAGKRFLWIGDLSRPDVLLAMIAAGLVAWSIALSGSSAPASGAQATTMLRVSMAISAVMTLVFLLSAGSGVAVSVAAGAVGAGVQGWLAAGMRSASKPVSDRIDVST